MKIVGKIYYQESWEKPFKAYIKKEATYCLGCIKRTDNKLITPKDMVNKFMAQKSICADYGSKKSISVKEYKPNKKSKNSFYKLQKHNLFIV